ncbi:MAG: hypothetical protein HY782_25725 [Chloroflexi bacterium]|nr:hypothetical protein [Chloroflexota bacterium]
MKKHPNHNNPINGFAQTLVTLRNRYFIALDLLAFCLTPVLAVWLRTDGTSSLALAFPPGQV